jgi:hypothetical protein
VDYEQSNVARYVLIAITSVVLVGVIGFAVGMASSIL